MRRMRSKPLQKVKHHFGQSGFTLIELMIVVAIVGVLAAIAIPQFASFRVKAYNLAALADLSNGMTAVQAFYTDFNQYPNTHNLVIAPNNLEFSNGANTLSWLISDGVAVFYEKGLTGFCLASKQQAGNQIYMLSDVAAQPVPLAELAAEGVVLDSAGAVVGTRNCSGMTKTDIEVISVGN